MRKLLCGLVVAGAVIAFPVAASACGYQMVYGNTWLGISEGCCEAGGHVNIHVIGKQICVATSGVDADDVLLVVCGIALPVAAVAVVLVAFLVAGRAKNRPSKATKRKRYLRGW